MNNVSPKPSFRYELKYRIENLGLGVILQSLKLHPASFRNIFPDRRVNNIYFDTIALNTYQDNVIGIADRKKIRARWYGEQWEKIDQATLEFKIKSNQLGYKKSFPLAKFSCNQLGNLTQEVGKICHTELQASLANTYLRSYYGTSDGKFRITIDRELAYFSFLTGRRFTRFTRKEDAIILELKYDADQEQASEFIRQYIPFRQTKSSKYVTGIQTCLLT